MEPLVRLYEDDQRRAMYPDGTATDDRLDGALDEFRPLPAIDTDADEKSYEPCVMSCAMNPIPLTILASGERTDDFMAPTRTAPIL
jgi:hypothetical protein